MCTAAPGVSYSASLNCTAGETRPCRPGGTVEAGVDALGVVSEGGSRFRFVAVPVVTGIEPAGASPAGGSLVTLTGSGFGLASDTVVARISAQDCSQTGWVSDTSAVCTVPSGSGGKRSVGVQVSTPTSVVYSTKAGAFSFSAPSVLQAQRAGVSMPNGPTSGGVSLTILGSGFGATNVLNDVTALVGDTVCASTGWTSDSSVGCFLSPGFGNAVDTTVRVACGTYGGPERYTCLKTTAPLKFSYDSPHLDRTDVDPAAVGEEAMSVTGTNFGIFDPTWTMAIGATSVNNLAWVSDTSVTARTRGGIGLNSIVMRVRTPLPRSESVQTTFVAAFTYRAPAVARLVPGFVAATGTQSITVFGADFGSFDHSPTVKIGSTNCLASVWHSDSSISCKTASGAYVQRPVHIEFLQSYNDDVVEADKAKALNYSSGSCEEVNPTPENLNPKP